MDQRPIVVVDGNNLAARCNYVLKDLQDATGKFSGVIFGVLNSLEGYIREWKPQEIVVAWDMGRSFWRLEVFPQYKAGRDKKRNSSEEEKKNYEDYKRQLGIVHEILDLHPVKNIRITGCEADDIAAYALTHYKPEVPKIIVSNDHDFWQCVSPTVSVWCPGREKFVTPESLYNDLQITPQEFLIVKCFVGDDSDEIPGYMGIGEKTAAKLVAKVRASGKDSTQIESYCDEEALALYAKTKRTSVITQENLYILKGNYVIMNLAWGAHRLTRDRGEQTQEQFSKPLQFDEAVIRDAFGRFSLNKFLTKFLEYQRTWQTLLLS